ncbi:MAG: hypothetical protein HYZ22_10920 [Chloroflexi bacterium]|nr:hypothetical protein [Chloroflexota bacterium]
MSNKKKTDNQDIVPWSFQDICRKLDGIALELAKEITKYKPSDLLHRAFWMNVYPNMKGLNEDTSEKDRYDASQTLEFIQNYLVSLEPIPAKRSQLDDKGWNKIESLVRDFNLYMIPFFILNSKNLQEGSEKYDIKNDELRTLDLMHWWSVRGNSFHVHHVAQVKELLLPQKGIFENIFDYRIDDFLGDLEKIQYSLTFGFGDAMNESISLFDKTIEFARGLSGLVDNPTIDQMDIAIEQAGVKDQAKDALDRAFGLALCDVGKITNMPTSLLSELSWQIGEDKEFWSEGMYAGWPLRVTPLRKRPFIKLDNRYYCFDLLNLFDNIYRRIEDVLFERKPEIRERWNEVRKETSEQVSLEYLSSMLPRSKVFSPVYYDKLSARKETDGIIIYDDVLIIVEVKSGALDTGSPFLDFDNHQKKLIELIENPATQAKRFREFLNVNKEIEIFDGNHKNSLVLSKLSAESFRKIYQCTVSVDNLTHLTARARKLAPLGIQVHTSANWSISLDDLRVYAELFESPLQFLHFLEQRQLAEESEFVELNDELDHLGLYLQKNNYSRHANELMEGKNPSRIYWDSFTKEIDDYFNKLFTEKSVVHAKPNQEMPEKLRELIALLEEQQKPGRVRAACFLLDGADDYRKTLEDGILRTLQRQTEVKRLNPFFIGGEMCVSCFCLNQNLKLPNKDWTEDYVKYRLLISGHNESLVLILQFNKDNHLTDVSFDFVLLGKATIMELERIRLWGERMKDSMTSYQIPTSK